MNRISKKARKRILDFIQHKKYGNPNTTLSNISVDSMIMVAEYNMDLVSQTNYKLHNSDINPTKSVESVQVEDFEIEGIEFNIDLQSVNGMSNELQIVGSNFVVTKVSDTTEARELLQLFEELFFNNNL